MITGVYKYNGAAQEYTKAKIEPQPWLHIAFSNQGGAFAIFVWDTRKVVEFGNLRYNENRTPKEAGLTRAKDNKQPLDIQSRYWSQDNKFAFTSDDDKFIVTGKNRYGDKEYALKHGWGMGRTTYTITTYYGFGPKRYLVLVDGFKKEEFETLNEAKAWVWDNIRH